MNTLTILGVTLLGFVSFGQGLTSQNINDKKVLYRGYENKIVLAQIGDDKELFEIEAVNCEVFKRGKNENENTYIVKTKTKEKTAKINVVSNGRTIERIIFNVKNLPTPSLFWGSNKEGTTISNSTEILIKYSPDVILESNFEIIGWSCKLDDMQFEGPGNLLSQEMMDYTKSMKKGERITVEVNILSTGGLIRKLSGSWEK